MLQAILQQDCGFSLGSQKSELPVQTNYHTDVAKHHMENRTDWFVYFFTLGKMRLVDCNENKLIHQPHNLNLSYFKRLWRILQTPVIYCQVHLCKYCHPLAEVQNNNHKTSNMRNYSPSFGHQVEPVFHKVLLKHFILSVLLVRLSRICSVRFIVARLYIFSWND